MKRLPVIFFLFAAFFQARGQNTLGIPDIINYSKSLYNAGISNWDIGQDKNGIVYFANTEGIVSFDGAYWKTYTFPSKTMARSLAIGEDNRIYAGSQDDFGYFAPDANGLLTFHSFKPLLSEKNKVFANVWDILIHGNDVLFRAETKIFRYSNGSLTVYPASAEWRFLGTSNQAILAQDSKNGLLKFTNGIWAPFLEESALPATNYVITAIVPFGKDSSLITTMRDGLYVLSGNKITRFAFRDADPFTNELILSCAVVNPEWLAIGTQLNGCYIVSKNGEIIQNFSRNEGLQNNCVLSLYLDRNRNLWMGLDNGIDFTAYNNGIKHIYPEHLNEGAGYSSAVYKNELFIGTSNQLYKTDISGFTDLSLQKGNFKPVPNTRGSTWGLFEVNGSLLLGHHDGAFEIKPNGIKPIVKTTGFWAFFPFYNVLPSSIVMAGKYNGLDFFSYSDNGFAYKSTIPGFTDGVKFAAVDNNNLIWIAHTYRGVFSMNTESGPNSSIKFYGTKNGLPSEIGNRLFKIKNRIVVSTEKGVYEYNEKKDSFEPSAFFKPIFGDRPIRYLKEDPEGNIWFIEEKMPGVVDFSGDKPRTVYFPELNNKIVSSYENINPINRFNVIIGAEKGFYHINYDQYRKHNYEVTSMIRSVKVWGKKDSLLFGGYLTGANDSSQNINVMPGVPHQWNSFHFEYSSPLNEDPGSVLYSYMLKGHDEDWSAWSKKTEKEYTNLAAGNYTFQVKAKSYFGDDSPVSSYSFTVLPPWYQTTYAYIAYAFVFMGGIYLLYNRQRKKFLKQQIRHEEEQKRLQYLHQLELEKSEKEIVTLKNEKLQSQIEHKNTELASVAMHLVQKGEMLTKIKEELTRIKNSNENVSSPANGHTADNEEFKKVLRILKDEDKLDKDWEQFAVHFDNVHSDFLKEMKEHYPTLSAHELKLCAYLRMNLSSKEIAQLMNISVRGVEISRYRLRKKLGIPTEVSLFDHLMKFAPTK